MKKDKYLGYWLIKGTNNFIKVIGECNFPRWRYVKLISKSFHGYVETSGTKTVDYLRVNCEKVTEETFKEYTKGKL